jgi:hypothetical protein
MMASIGNIDESIRLGAVSSDGWGTEYSMVLEATPYIPQMDNRI